MQMTSPTQHEMLDWTRRKSSRQRVSPATAGLIVIGASLASILLLMSQSPAECHELRSINNQNNFTTTTTTTPSRVNRVESLAKLLQATDQRQRAAAAVAETEARGNSTNQQQQEQLKYLNALANKKISCDELSLVVLAQRVLNMSSSSATISRLIECKQENLLDAHLMDMFAGRGGGGGTDQQVATRTSRQQPAPNEDQDTLTPEEQHFAGGSQQPPEVQRHEQREGRLHFGAKLAISLLATVITLVAVATAVDYQLDPSGVGGESSRGRKSDFRLPGKRARVKRESYQAAKLRDYRSLSMSSNCSSNLFCSTSSVASSSAPIMGRPATAAATGGGQATRMQTQTGGSEHTQQPPRHYETNLQLHFNQQSNCSSESGISVRSAVAKQQEDAADEPTTATHEINDVRQIVHANKTRQNDSLELARQVLLAFSLRQSARAIFEHSPPAADQSSRESARSESVDSLHGLRFLSMIWVIVIHSYNFALRWMFFSNTNTLDGIYKSAASQLIANGSFACDSFFFAGGFLLPYLAYSPPPPQSTAESDDLSEKQQQVATENPCASPETRGSGGQPEVGSAATGGCSERVPAASCCCPADTAAAAAQLRGPPSGATPPTCCCSCCYSSCEESSENQQHARHELHTDEPRGSPPVVTIINMEAVKQTVTGAKASPRAAHAHKDAVAHSQDLKSSGVAAEAKNTTEAKQRQQEQFTCKQIVANVCHRYARMMPLMMAIIGLCSTLLRYLGDGPLWQESTMMYDDWCQRNWWVNAMFLHNFVNRQNMCLSHSWYSAVDFQLFLVGQLVLWTLNKSKRLGYLLLFCLLAGSPLLTMLLTLKHHLPAVPLVANVNEQTMNLYYGEIYIKPYSRASPYLVGMLLAYLLRTTRLGQWRPRRWQVALGWSLSLLTFAGILMAMQPAMNGRAPSELESALYSGWSRPLWACATGWMIFACMTKRGGPIEQLLSARLFVPLSRLTYPAFLIHPIVMALFYGSRTSSFQFSHYLMLYLILGNIVITYASAFVLAALFELPLLSIERTLSRRIFGARARATN